jgi:hypothetical protein
MIVLKSAQEKFLGALQAVSGIVERRHTLPILANVLIRAPVARTALELGRLPTKPLGIAARWPFRSG